MSWDFCYLPAWPAEMHQTPCTSATHAQNKAAEDVGTTHLACSTDFDGKLTLDYQLSIHLLNLPLILAYYGFSHNFQKSCV